MGVVQPLRAADRASGRDYLHDYARDGYAVIRGLFSRRLGAWFGEDTSVAVPAHAEKEKRSNRLGGLLRRA